MIVDGATLATQRRMLVLGLVDGIEIEIETRGRHGDVIIICDAARYLISAFHAEHIWVEPVVATDSPRGE